jgi:hypothetical protein
MIEPGKPRPRVGLLRPYINAVEAVDRYHVKVTLHYPLEILDLSGQRQGAHGGWTVCDATQFADDPQK